MRVHAEKNSLTHGMRIFRNNFVNTMNNEMDIHENFIPRRFFNRVL
jgi:hypothetical protein